MNTPLSWSQKNIESLDFKSVKLRLSGLNWVYSAAIPFGCSNEVLFAQLKRNFPDGFLLRGSSFNLASDFLRKGCEVVRTGAEAVINLEDVNEIPTSVSSLVSRGTRHGVVKEIALNQLNQSRVSDFINQTPYGTKPHLKYLFINSFDANTRCFVMNSKEGRWLGVITVSQSAEDYCHVEMILRHKKAPVGVMENLLFSVMKLYRDEGFKEFSLGEVPFITPENISEDRLDDSLNRSIKEQLLFKSGHFLKYAFNYKGLFDFKDKFNPTWKPVYICGSSHISFLSVIDLFYETGYLELCKFELIANIKTYSELLSTTTR